MSRRFTIKSRQEHTFTLRLPRGSFYVNTTNLGLYWSLYFRVSRFTFDLHWLGQLGRLPIRRPWLGLQDDGWREWEDEKEIIVFRTLRWRSFGFHYAERIPPRSRKRSWRLAFGRAS